MHKQRIQNTHALPLSHLFQKLLYTTSAALYVRPMIKAVPGGADCRRHTDPSSPPQNYTTGSVIHTKPAICFLVFSHLFCLVMAVLKYSNTFRRRSLALSFSSISLNTLLWSAGRPGGRSRRSKRSRTWKQQQEDRKHEKKPVLVKSNMRRYQKKKRRRQQRTRFFYSTIGNGWRTETATASSLQASLSKGGQNITRRRSTKSTADGRETAEEKTITPIPCDRRTKTKGV